MTKLPFDEPRCQDALEAGCPDRKVCARWELRNPHWPTTPWEKFAAARGPKGCASIIRLEVASAVQNDL